jgi:hypothetical protein
VIVALIAFVLEAPVPVLSTMFRCENRQTRARLLTVGLALPANLYGLLHTLRIRVTGGPWDEKKENRRAKEKKELALL